MATTSVVNVRSTPNFQSRAGVAPKGPRLVIGRHGVASAGTKEFPPFRLDIVNRCLWRRSDHGNDIRILVKPTPFAILRYLVDHAGRLVTQEELLDAVWPDTNVQPEVLKRHVFEIRNLLGDHPKNPTYIETLPRRGYQFIASVHGVAPAEPPVVDMPEKTKLVARHQPLGVLRSCLDLASGGERRIVFVTGEPGIGKTTLLDEFQRQSAGAPIRIARGQCVEGYGGKEPYYPVLEALGNLFQSAAGDAVVRILAAQAPTWLVQFPTLVKRAQRQLLESEILGATKQRMLREIGDALETIACETPLLLVLEDLHWADPSTVDLISALARGRRPAKLLIIGTYRPVDLTLSAHPLEVVKQDLMVHQLCHEIALQPLGEREIGSYLAAEPELATLLHRYSEGNPLFMAAALEHLAVRDLVARENGRWQLRVPLQEIDLEPPESLRQMIETQINRLSGQEQRSLEIASVIGGVFSAAVSAMSGGMDVQEFETLCEGLSRRRHILRSAGPQELPKGGASERYQFVHALYREVLYRRQSPGNRAKLHLQAAERLEELFEHRPCEVATELAHHFEKGGDARRARKYLQLKENLKSA